MDDRGRVGRYVVALTASLVLGPVLAAGGLVALTAIVGEWFDFRLFDLSGISFLDWLYGGPGAGPNSFENYVTFMIAGGSAAACFGTLGGLWRWARRDRSP